MEKSTVYFTDFRCPVGTSQLDQIIFKIFEELLTIVCVRVILHIEQKRWTGDAVKITASLF